MEDSLKKIVNIGIGAFKTIQEEYGGSLGDLEKKVGNHLKDMESRGAKADDEVSSRIKTDLDRFINFVRDAQTSYSPSGEPAKKKTSPSSTSAKPKKKAAAKKKTASK